MAARKGTKMNESTRGYAPAEAAQQQAQEPPDYLMLAGRQLAHVSHAIKTMAEVENQPAGAVEKIIDLRLKVAAGYTELAAIQYGIPGDDEYEDLDLDAE
jgi:hypothetical protein